MVRLRNVESVGDDQYWWGGNLAGVHAHPIALSRPDKLVYSAHEYGPEVHAQPWFSAADFPDNLPSIWTRHFDFIIQEELGHLLIGEFGIKDPAAFEGRAGVWFETLMATMGDRASWTF